MNTHNHSTYQPDMPVEIGMDSIDLREVQANDHLLFWTQRSCYSFRVTDATDFRGQLSRSGEQAALPFHGDGAERAADQQSLNRRAELKFLNVGFKSSVAPVFLQLELDKTFELPALDFQLVDAAVE